VQTRLSLVAEHCHEHSSLTGRGLVILSYRNSWPNMNWLIEGVGLFGHFFLNLFFLLFNVLIGRIISNCTHTQSVQEIPTSYRLKTLKKKKINCNLEGSIIMNLEN